MVWKQRKTEKWSDEGNGTAINMKKAFRIQAIFGARVEDESIFSIFIQYDT